MPAAAAKPAEGMLDFVIKLAGVLVFVVGVATLASPWLSSADRPLPPPGWICFSVTRSTSAESERSRTCRPSPGFHEEDWDGIGRVSVPPPWRRHYVRDGY
jgi:hypothetical protein